MYNFSKIFIQNNNIRQIPAGSMHSVALTVDDNPYSWGSADYGALGRIVKSDNDQTVLL